MQTECIAAIDENYKKIPESNYGSVVDYLAPGNKIMSTYIRNDNDVAKLTGTSQACAFATGAAAIFTFVSPRHWVVVTVLRMLIRCCIVARFGQRPKERSVWRLRLVGKDFLALLYI